MVFSSLIFIFRFLPIALFIYYITPKKLKNLILLILSLFFYSVGEPKYFLIMIASIIIDYTLSLIIEKNRGNSIVCISALIISLSVNLGLLFIFKYLGFFITSINEIFNTSFYVIELTLPLGISFYTFQTLSYTIDVFRGKVSAERNIITLGAYIALFPQLIAGPIVKYQQIKDELKERRINSTNIEEGIELFVLGLGMKVLLANNIGMLWDEVYNLGFNKVSTILVWLSLMAFALQIYFDFNGYSYMAMGLGKLLGFTFPNNFNYPYISKSISEFWRRWHITLGNWFKEYVYIPLGGNRVSIYRNIFNLFIVWFLTGIWHGASYNFILWGLYFFMLIVLEKYFLLEYLEKHKVTAHIYTLLTLLIGWGIFATNNFQDLILLMNKMFSFQYSTDWLYYVSNYGVIFIIGMFFSTPLISIKYRKLDNNSYIKIAILLIISVLSIAYLVDSSYNPFLYFRF